MDIELGWGFSPYPEFARTLTTGFRRTGITLKEGKRDEHGMEEIDGMFSSPEKSPVRPNGFNNGNETIMGSEGMSMDEGTSCADRFLAISYTFVLRCVLSESHCAHTNHEF